MASAATAKRRMDLNSGIGGRVKARAASAGPPASPTDADKTRSEPNSPTTTDAGAGAGSNLSDKRRMAALISWEKRRKASEKAEKAARGAASAKGRSSAAVATAKGRGRKAAPAPPAKRRKVDAKPLSRSEAAKVGWERRKRELAAQEQARDVRRQAAKMGWAKRKGQKVQKTAKDVRSEAARRGWERRKSQLKAESKPLSRSEAAKLGWERRKSQLAEAEAKSNSSESDASSEEEESEDEEPRSVAASRNKKAASTRKVYTAKARAEAARRGWERKKREQAEAARRASYGDASSVSSVPSRKSSSSTSRSTATAASKPKKEAKVKQYREGTKRSSRLADESSTDIYEEMKKVNDLVTRLRERGWMEFHPSSRHGSGTATYGYIPSSIASFIRSGYVSQGAVIENGELGIHYALDYEGYGGLKEMIDTFGEDFSPCITDKMMDLSRVAEWELGEDLPWREVEEAENKKMRELVEEKAVLEDGSDASEGDEEVEDDILFVAGILASLDQEAVKEEMAALKESQVGNEAECATSTSDPRTPSMLALKDYESSGDGSDGSESHESNPLSHLADASMTREEECKTQSKIVEEEEDVLIIQSRPSQEFRNWTFGIC